MRFLTAILTLAFVWLQAYLWLSDSGFRNTSQIREAVLKIRSENTGLRARNNSLAAEVRNLKSSFEATEERARSDLGMIGPRETFYQVVPTGDDGGH